jgi:hypothetical protein
MPLFSEHSKVTFSSGEVIEISPPPLEIVFFPS